MRVLITHELFPPDFAGGGEKIVYELAKELKSQGIYIEVLTTGNPKIKSFKGIKTHRLPINRYMLNFSGKSIEKYATGFDIIQTNNYNACLPSLKAGKKLNIPVVCLVHGIYRDKWMGMRGPIFGRLSKQIEAYQLKQNYDKIVFYSNFAKKEGIKLGLPKNRIKMFYPGVDYRKYKIKKKGNHVLFVGRLAKQKGLDTLIKVAEELPDTEFKIVGGGEEEKRLKSIAPNNVKFLGFKTGHSLIDIYSKSPILCLPSLGETFGLVILEAMASGCAIVSTVPLDYKGKKIDYGSTTQLKLAIKHLIKNREITLKIGKENRKLAKNYSWKKFSKGFINVYNNLLARK